MMDPICCSRFPCGSWNTSNLKLWSIFLPFDLLSERSIHQATTGYDANVMHAKRWSNRRRLFRREDLRDDIVRKSNSCARLLASGEGPRPMSFCLVRWNRVVFFSFLSHQSNLRMMETCRLTSWMLQNLWRLAPPLCFTTSLSLTHVYQDSVPLAKIQTISFLPTLL